MKHTIALACILKNELKNLPRLLASVEGCFDEIHLTDTGSTDGSIEWIEKYRETHPEVQLHHFKWCDDFSAARNASFDPARTDYVMWMDLDDVLADREKFISWRDSVMKLADFWMNTYHYALDGNGRPTCSFARERVVKRSHGLKWKYFVHEGILPSKPGLVLQYAATWSVHHLRDAEDLNQDKSRNLSLFEKRRHDLDSRMRYYYGKELFEAGKPLEAYQVLMEAITDTALEQHDRVMGIQLATMAAAQLGQMDRAVSLAHQGLALAPQRAEFFVAIADSHLKMNRAGDAVPFYEAATKCCYGGQGLIQGPIFQMEQAYKHYPLNQLARIYANAGDMDRAEHYAKEASRLGPDPDTAGILANIEMVKSKVRPIKERTKTTDIVISCPPQSLYEWDPKVYAEKGVGGSETAAVEMAGWLSRITKRRVLVFNVRQKSETFDGVEYRPTTEYPEYMRDNSPAAVINWRHGMKISDDPTYVWCHDLGFQGLENHSQYTKVLTLSPFHREYVRNFFNVPEEKIAVTRNGIEPRRFIGLAAEKTPGKVVWSSSPDRGLDRAIRVMELVVKHVPTAKLHVYYGFDNMRKMGMTAEIERYEKLMAGKDFIVFHGNLPQSKLTEELKSACVWLYPTNFLETFCITALEMISAGVYPVARKWGALEDTLAAAEKDGMATLIDADCETEDEVIRYAEETVAALAGNRHEMVEVDARQFSWESVAQEWVSLLGLSEDECQHSISTQSRTA